MKEKVKKIKMRATAIEFLKNRGVFYGSSPSNLQLYFDLRRIGEVPEADDLNKSTINKILLGFVFKLKPNHPILVSRKMERERLNESGRRISSYAVALKKRATKPEKALCDALLDAGIRFTFQKFFFAVDRGFIVDFFLKRFNRRPLVVEVDGGNHFTAKGKSYDADRTAWLTKNRHCEVIRFTNEEVLADVERVLNIIIENGAMFKAGSPREMGTDLDNEFKSIIGGK